ncbi:MAG: protein adenylyltransferase SelO family protein, partial [Cyanobacteria bacterium]|nr:protein adenylyltransferase SelO family protein [Cyanobacteriota bacterium]
QLLVDWPVAYGTFFASLERHVALAGLPAEAEALAPFVPGAPDPPRAAWLAWRDAWWTWSRTWPQPETIAPTLTCWNLPVTPVRAEIERIWAAIDQRDDWSLLEDWLEQTRG